MSFTLSGLGYFREFVDWVRCIKILYPQEVQQMSLDGDIGNSVLQKEACNSVLLVLLQVQVYFICMQQKMEDTNPVY